MNLLLKVFVPPFRAGDVIAGDALPDADDRVRLKHAEWTAAEVTNFHKNTPPLPPPVSADRAVAEAVELRLRVQSAEGRVAMVEADLAAARKEAAEWKEMAETETAALAAARTEIDALRAEVNTLRTGGPKPVSPVPNPTPMA